MKELHNIYFSNLNAICNLGGFFNPALDTDWSYREHSFSQNKFYCITKGCCKITVDGTEYIAKAGDWFLIPTNTPHSYSNFIGKPFEKYWMHFDIYPDTDFFKVLNLPHFVNFSERKEVKRLFSRFVVHNAKNTLADRIKVKSILLSLIAEYLSLSYPNGIDIKSEDDSRIDDILRHIAANLDKPLNNMSLAAEFYMHPNHFIRFFKNKTGHSPARYIKLKRMETAKQLLEDTDLYITEIMEKIGETDVSSFSKQFKSVYAQSPRECRNFFKASKQI